MLRSSDTVGYRSVQFMSSPPRRLFAVVLALGALAAAGCGSSSSSGSRSTTGATTAGVPRLSAKANNAKSDGNVDRVLAGDPIVAKYHVKNGELGDFVNGRNRTAYRDYDWRFYTQLIPQDDRKAITFFAIFEPKGSLADVLGFVAPLNDVGSSWVLAVDSNRPDYELADTFVHETMHMLALSGRQIDVRVSPRQCFTHVDIGSIGCPRRGSYLYAFIKRFWAPLFPQWRQAEKDKTIAAFYKKHKSDFTREYAATSPTEDISESFAAYVLNTRGVPSGVVAKEKFFKAYPNLVAIKTYAEHNVPGLAP